MGTEVKDNTVPTPTTWTQKSQAAFNTRTAAAHAAHLVPHLKPTDRILDVGCGPGSITLDLARLVPEGSVVGVDVNADSLALARSSAKEQAVTNVEFIECDAMDLSAFGSEAFHVVHAHQVLLHVTNPLMAMQEMRRVVKPGGILSTRDNSAMYPIPLSPAIENHMDIFHRFARSRGADTQFGRVNHIAAHNAGFEWDKIEMSSWGWEWSDKKAKENMAQLGRSGLREQFIAAGLATEAELDASAAAWEEWKSLPEARYIGLDGALLCWK